MCVHSMTDEEYLMAALELDPKAFLAFFSEVNPQTRRKYEDLCRQNNTLDEFTASPLIFILANNPRCCTPIAKAYVEKHCAATDCGGEVQRPRADDCAAGAQRDGAPPEVKPCAGLRWRAGLGRPGAGRRRQLLRQLVQFRGDGRWLSSVVRAH
mmetsp:Transcript_101225/g.326715  ORF Transcript_101225/g.326715 Transcript_101225/m.326715 type:complete len:154 (-) Transcript_101225:180-641(-)